MPVNNTVLQPAKSELELKFRLQESDIFRLRQLSFLKSNQISRRKTSTLTSIYFDTTDYALIKRGIGLRVREYHGRFFQSVKSMGVGIDGLHKRLEWEDKISSRRPDFKKLCQSPFCHAFINLEQNVLLEPMFSTVVKRTIWLVEWLGGQFEVAMDIGDYWVKDKKVSPIRELEIELLKGSENQLISFATTLQTFISLEIETNNKAEIGYRHFQKIQSQSV